VEKVTTASQQMYDLGNCLTLAITWSLLTGSCVQFTIAIQNTTDVAGACGGVPCMHSSFQGGRQEEKGGGEWEGSESGRRQVSLAGRLTPAACSSVRTYTGSAEAPATSAGVGAAGGD
jgi:hypothetical protein